MSFKKIYETLYSGLNASIDKLAKNHISDI